MVRGIFPGEGALGAFTPGDFVLLRRQLLPPFGVGLLDSLHFHYSQALAVGVELRNLDHSPGGKEPSCRKYSKAGEQNGSTIDWRIEHKTIHSFLNGAAVLPLSHLPV